MPLSIHEPVSVTMMYNHHQHKSVPLELMWRNRHYPITQIGLHHTIHTGQTLKHIFSVTSQNMFFELAFDTTDLTWELQQSDAT